LDRRLDGPQSRSGHGGEEKNSQPPLAEEENKEYLISTVTGLDEYSNRTVYVAGI
jgi:hypothetical protein